MLTRDEAIDILEMYIAELENKNISKKESLEIETHIANQNNIDEFFR